MKKIQCYICGERNVTLHNAICNFTLLWENYLSPPLALFLCKEYVRNSFLSLKKLIQYQGHSLLPSPHSKPAAWKLCLWHWFPSLIFSKLQIFIVYFFGLWPTCFLGGGRVDETFSYSFCYVFLQNSGLTSRLEKIVFLFYIILWFILHSAWQLTYICAIFL